jgi:hypothetical protein
MQLSVRVSPCTLGVAEAASVIDQANETEIVEPQLESPRKSVTSNPLLLGCLRPACYAMAGGEFLRMACSFYFLHYLY